MAIELRGYAQMMVSGTDLYADLTTLSIGVTSQLVQPLITPGAYGTVLRYANANSGTALTGTAAYAIAQGATFSGGAGATFTFAGSSGGEEVFAADVTGASSQTMQVAPASSTPNAAYAVNKSSGAAGGRLFNVKAWFDGTY